MSLSERVHRLLNVVVARAAAAGPRLGFALVAVAGAACGGSAVESEAPAPLPGLVAPWSSVRIPGPGAKVVDCAPQWCEIHHSAVLIPELGERYVRALERQGLLETQRLDASGLFHAEFTYREQTIYLAIRGASGGADARLSLGSAR